MDLNITKQQALRLAADSTDADVAERILSAVSAFRPGDLVTGRIRSSWSARNTAASDDGDDRCVVVDRVVLGFPEVTPPGRFEVGYELDDGEVYPERALELVYRMP